MFKRFITVCLVISSLGYGVAWAFDGHWDVTQASADASFGQHADDDIPASGEHNDAGCDHCCHASAHLVGIAPAATKGLFVNRSNLYSVFTVTMISHLELPTSPPPKY